MIDRATRLRWRRRFRRGQHRVEDLTLQADEHLEKHFIKRLSKFAGVRRFIFSWASLLLLIIAGLIVQTRHLSSYYLTLKPAPGGIFTEGMLGTFSNANPIYVSGNVDATVSKLIFSSLLKYSEDNAGLIGDLAENWAVDEKGTTYTVKLKAGVKWHDGQPLTSADVVFTYGAITNADAKSPLFASWQGITVEASDELTVIFRLPNAFSAFPHSLTNGIVPKHLLDKIPMPQLRSVPFNNVSPVGSGPFKWQKIEISEGVNFTQRQQSIGLTLYDNYHFGKPKLAKLVVRTYQDEKALITAMLNKEVTSAVGLVSVPEELMNVSEVEQYNIPLTGGIYAFFKISNEILAERPIRQALVFAADPREVIRELGFPAVAVDAPLLRKHIGYNAAFRQLSSKLAEANQILDASGWALDPATGLRFKGGKKLSIRLFSESTSEYTKVAQILQKQWRAAGIDVEVKLLPVDELEAVIGAHDYDVLLYGILLGIDPDVYPYWHSSQADPRATSRLNFSEYKSPQVDLALEAGRTRSDPELRAVKYRPFLEAWRNDSPALALYQPRFLYLAYKPLHGFNPDTMNQPVDRFVNVHNWAVREERAIK